MKMLFKEERAMRKRIYPVMLLLAGLCLSSCMQTLPEEEETLPPAAEETIYVTAGFEGGGSGTRTSLSMNEAGTNASVLWTSGDSFRALVQTGTNSYSYSNYTTGDSGPVATFSGRISGAGPYYCIYPASRAGGVVSLSGVSEPVLIASIPANQQAVPGGIANGLNVAVAYTTDMSAHLQFRNILSYIRFRLSGAATASVTSVHLDAAATLAGDATVYGTPSGGAEARFDVNWAQTSEPRSSEIILSGSFETGQDYYLALAPVSLNGFNLVFEDADGHRIRKHSSLSLSLDRSRIYDFGTIEIGDAFPSDDSGESVIQYMSATPVPGRKPIDLCVISEGFVKEDLPRFRNMAVEAIDFLFDTEPYKSYRDYFNAYILSVASEQSGASVTDGNGTITSAKDSYFGARWGQNSYGDMAANETTVYNYVSRHCPDIVAGTHRINDVSILMLINDSRYGGICHTYSDGRNYSMVPYIDNGGTRYWQFPGIHSTTDDPLPTPVTQETLGEYYRRTTQAEMNELGRTTGDWRNTVIHEFGGHGFGRLGDEYWSSDALNYISGSIDSHRWPVPFALNVAAQPSTAPWAEDLLSQMDILTARDERYGRIGIFQGAEGYIYGRWRSEKISCMIDNRPYYSAWQRMLIVRRIKSLAGETFSAEDFFTHDVTRDPIRDRAAGTMSGSGIQDGQRPATDGSGREAVYGPPLPPPVLHDVRALPRVRE